MSKPESVDRSGGSGLLSGMDAAELEELRASSTYADPVIQRAVELEERLRVTIKQIRETQDMPPVMQRVGFAAICVDIDGTVNRDWLAR